MIVRVMMGFDVVAAVFIWGQLQPSLPNLLDEDKIHETENNVVVYCGDFDNGEDEDEGDCKGDDGI